LVLGTKLKTPLHASYVETLELFFALSPRKGDLSVASSIVKSEGSSSVNMPKQTQRPQRSKRMTAKVTMRGNMAPISIHYNYNRTDRSGAIYRQESSQELW